MYDSPFADSLNSRRSPVGRRCLDLDQRLAIGVADLRREVSSAARPSECSERKIILANSTNRRLRYFNTHFLVKLFV